MASLETWLRLAFIPGLGPVRLHKLVDELGSVEAVLAAAPGALRNAVGAEIADAIKQGGNREAADAALRWQNARDQRLLTVADTDYPRLLRETADPPPVLFVKGDASLLSAPALAVVGSRNATAQGCATAEAFAQALSGAGLTIVSGLALGVDAAAHCGGLAGAARSIAIVGTGIDIVYPARNRALAHRLAAEGALVSEFALGTRPLAGNFPRRNRVLAGLTLGCLVVEAATRSGSLITARFAAEQGREVFAIPGSIHSPLSKGCHLLIKQGAKLVDHAHDILEELRLPAPALATEKTAGPELGDDATRALTTLGWDPCDTDTLAQRTQIPPARLQALLLGLELAGEIALLPGGRVQRLRRGV